jgi:hypothetical protein
MKRKELHLVFYKRIFVFYCVVAPRGGYTTYVNAILLTVSYLMSTMHCVIISEEKGEEKEEGGGGKKKLVPNTCIPRPALRSFSQTLECFNVRTFK